MEGSRGRKEDRGGVQGEKGDRRIEEGCRGRREARGGGGKL